MFQNPLLLLGISTIAAAIPVGVWIYFLFNKKEKSKKIIALVFGLGCLTAPALLGLQYVWDIFPNFNLAVFIESSVQTQSLQFIAMFLLFAAMEEIIKMYVISAIDKKTLLIKTVGDSVHYSLAAALGFSFTENIYYLYEFWPVISTGELVGMYIFRSIFTTCAHMIFSGVFGYYYGVGKFSIHLNKQARATQEKSRIRKFIARLFNIPLSHAFQQQAIIKGLVIAIFIHAVYNYLLQFNIILPVIAFVVLGYLYLQYLLKRKAGHLILANDISQKGTRTIAKKDSEVVVDLLGMWFKDKRYVDVLHICERLLERDPDNTVVKIFKAKALDKMDDSSAYKKILSTVVKSKEDLSSKDRNLIAKYTEEKEIFNKVKRMIKTQMKKEGREYVDPAKRTEVKGQPKEITITEQDKQDGTFKI